MARRSRAELIAALREDEKLRRERRLKLEAREKQEQRKRDTRRNALAGAAVLAHASVDPGFAAALRDVLEKAALKPADRELLGDLIYPEAPANDTEFDSAGTTSEPPAQESNTHFSAETIQHHQS